MAQTLRGYPIRVRHVTVGQRRYEVVGPGNYDSLIDDPRVAIRFEQDEFLPYWAEFWPACVLLAEEVDRWPKFEAIPSQGDGVDNCTSASAACLRENAPLVLELGCGLGLASLVALSRGCRVIASDYEDDALAFVLESARRSGLPEPRLEFIDWRRTYPELSLDRIVAAEVLHEQRNLEPIARFIQAHLAPSGVAQIIDGNRCVADTFPSAAADHGLLSTVSPRQSRGFDGRPVAGRLFQLSHRLA